MALAGLLLVVSVFAPWTSFIAEYVDGGQGTHTFSGWDLTVDCASRKFPGQCVFEDHSISPEFIPDGVIAGDWAPVAGLALLPVGVALARAKSARVTTLLFSIGWLVAVGALACGVATIIALIIELNGPPRPSVEFGVFLAARRAPSSRSSP